MEHERVLKYKGEDTSVKIQGQKLMGYDLTVAWKVILPL